MTDLALVMPMAGRGSRFARQGIVEPKPLVDLGGKPFFWWATESVRRQATVGELLFVVLEEHVRDWSIDERIADHYPDARVVVIPDVTSGAAETAAVGLREVVSTGPVAVNDCDHAFAAPALADTVAALEGSADGALLCFRSDSPAFSYARVRDDGTVEGTVEKQVVSPYAIAGCYMVSNAATFLDLYEGYRDDCPYDELFVSGIYTRLAERGGRILRLDAERHVSFGTPEEHARVDPSMLPNDLGWDRRR